MAAQHVENGENLNEKSKKTKKNQMENSILDDFTKLKHSNDQIRIKASIDLLRHLIVKENDEKINNNELKYALTRLIRGLGSSNLQARTGYFVVLVGLFNLKKHIEIDEIFDIIDKELHKSGSNTKSENADISMGKILVIGAIIRSKHYQKFENNDKRRVIEMLLNAGKQRDYLPLISYNFLVDLIDQIDGDEFEIIADLVCNEAVKTWQNQSLDSLYLLQRILVKFPNIVDGKLLKNTLGTTRIFCSENLQQLCATLTDSLRINSLKHPVYDCIVQQLIGGDLIVDFCRELDRILTKSNRNRYLIVVKILTRIIENLKDASILPDLIQTNFLQQTINNFKTFNSFGKGKDKEFHQIINNFFTILLNRLKSDQIKSKIKLKLIKKFLFYPGTFIFEKITKTKLIQNITLTLDSRGIRDLSNVYIDVILAKTDKIIGDNQMEKWWNLDRIYAASLLVKLLNYQVMNDEIDWKIDKLKLLMNLGVFNDQQYGNIGQELADAIKETFYAALDLKLTKLDDLCRILKEIVNEIDNRININNLNQILRHPIDIEDYKIWQKTNELIEKITKKHSNSNKKRVFLILFLHLNLQLFNHNTKLASDSLKELFNCYQRIKKDKHKNNDDNDLQQSDDPTWIEVIIDLFLNLLSHKSRLLRDIINCVFPYLCPYLTIQTIHQIISAIDPKIEENPLSRDSDSDDDDDDDDDESNDDDDSSDNDNDNDTDEDLDNERVNDKFRMALQQILISNNTDDLDLDDLNDEDGVNLDKQLAQVFKQYKPNLVKKSSNNKQTKNDELLTHFRIRVLDLIEIYLNTNPKLLITIELLLPLLELFEFCIRDNYQKPLQDRCLSCLKKLTTLKKFGDIDNVTIDTLIGLLNQLLDKGTKNSLIIQDMGEKISDCCIFIINCCQLITTKKKYQLKIARILRDNLEIFFAKRDCLIPFILFKNVLQLNWYGILLLIPLLYQVIYTETVRPYRRNQALELLRIFYNNHRFHQNHCIDDLDDVHLQFLNDTIEFLKKFNNDPKSMKIREKFISNLFYLLSQLKQLKQLNDNENWLKFNDLIQECRSVITMSKDTRVNYRKLCRMLNIKHTVVIKSDVIKLNDNNDDDDDDDHRVNEEMQKNKKNKNRKHKINQDVLKMKKETKKLRLEGLSEGILNDNKRKIVYNGGLNNEDSVGNCKKLKV